MSTNQRRNLPPESLTALIRALLEQLPEDSSPVLISVKPEPGSPNPVMINGHRINTATTTYDPRIVYILELASMLAIKDENSTAAVGKDVTEALQNFVRGSANTHPLVVSRAVFYLLHLLSASHVSRPTQASVALLTLHRSIHSYALQ